MTAPTEPEQARPVARSSAILLITLGGLSTLGPLSFDLYLPAFPQIQRDLPASPAQIQLTLLSCLAGMAVGQLVVGPLSDRYGRRRPVIVGLSAYVLVSLLCAAAPSAPVLIALRFVQGVAGSAGASVSRAVVRDLWSGALAARYFSRLTLVFGLAPVVAPTLGAQTLRFTDWRGTFLVQAALGVALVLVAGRWLPETLPAFKRSSAGLAGPLGGAGTVLRDRVFVGYALATGLAFSGLFAYLSTSSFIMQDVFGMSAQDYGILFGVNAAGFVLIGQLNARLVGRSYGPRRLYFTALGVNAAAGATLIVAAGTTSLPLMASALFVVVGSLGMSFPNGFALAMQGHPSAAGTTSALLGFVQSAIAVVVGPLVAWGGTSSGLPMAVGVFSFAALALLIAATLTRPSPLAAT